jgi:hypothetical protein
MEKFKLLNVHLLFFFLSALALSACAADKPIPDPETAAGVYIQTGFEFYRWEAGLRLMIWHDGIKSSDCATTTNSRSFELHCHAISNDGIRFEWHLETNDGRNANFSINNHSFDLAVGNLFVITTSRKGTNVMQLERDLSEVLAKADSVKAFGVADPTIKEHFQILPGLEDCISSLTNPEETSGTTNTEAAKEALMAFFSNLHAGEYEQAAALYGGEYEVMREHNPDIEPDDHAAFFRNACTINGAQCREIRQATLLDKPKTPEFRFAVQFVNDDDLLFTLGPCCGDEHVEGSQQDEFLYTVRLDCTGRYLVVEMPVYVP